MLKQVLAIPVCRVRNGKQSLGIWCVIAEVFLELKAQIWTLQDTTFTSIDATKYRYGLETYAEVGQNLANHTLCSNTILSWLQDFRLLEWPPGMESGGQEIRASYQRKRGLPLSGSHSESHPKCRTFPGFCHYLVAGRVAAYKDFCSRKLQKYWNTCKFCCLSRKGNRCESWRISAPSSKADDRKSKKS